MGEQEARWGIGLQEVGSRELRTCPPSCPHGSHEAVSQGETRPGASCYFQLCCSIDFTYKTQIHR